MIIKQSMWRMPFMKIPVPIQQPYQRDSYAIKGNIDCPYVHTENCWLNIKVIISIVGGPNYICGCNFCNYNYIRHLWQF